MRRPDFRVKTANRSTGSFGFGRSESVQERAERVAREDQWAKDDAEWQKRLADRKAELLDKWRNQA